jgi:hypothetical protein
MAISVTRLVLDTCQAFTVSYPGISRKGHFVGFCPFAVPFHFLGFRYSSFRRSELRNSIRSFASRFN